MISETQIFVFFRKTINYVTSAHLVIKLSWEANLWLLVSNFIKEISRKTDFIEVINFKR